MRKVLVLGGGGFVGRHLCRHLGAERMVATSRHGQGVVFDAASMRLKDLQLDWPAFSHAVVLIGDTNPDSCARNPQASRRLNVDGVKAVLGDLATHGIIPVFTSTEVVFDGTKGDYREEDAVNPLMLYGAQKVEIERLMPEDGLVVRLARVFGTTAGDKTLFTDWQAALECDADIRCATDQVFSPLHVDEVVSGLTLLIERDCRGLYHLSNPAAWSRIDLLRCLIEAQGEAGRPYRGRIEECRMADFTTLEPRPRDVSLDPAKLVAATGLEIASIESWCRRLAGGAL